MKKILILATAAFLFSGVSFAQEDKNCDKAKKCCKKESKTAKKADKKIKTLKA
jgi:hypothetical protein